VLLAAIGAKMLWETFHGGDEEANTAITALDHKELFLLAIATSIDALAVGVTFAFLDVALLPSVTLIGCTTFLLSAIGMKLGSVFGDKYEKKANILGGVILICLGVKILLEHLLG
jgi:putative Mn2+ efflux pump MntP